MLKSFVSQNQILESERALLQCWPTLETIEDGGWIIRLANGYTGRANSLQCLDPEDGQNVGARLDRAIEIFGEKNITPIVRATPLTCPELLTEVAQRNWRAFGHTNVMRILLVGHKLSGSHPGIELCHASSAIWQTAMTKLLGLGEVNAEIRSNIIGKMPDRTLGLLMQSGVVPTAGLLANIWDRTGCVFSLEVAPSSRRQGFGFALMQESMTWMAQQGAQLCTLQVEQSNENAHNLYTRLGFETIYTYHYYSPEGSL